MATYMVALVEGTPTEMSHNERRHSKDLEEGRRMGRSCHSREGWTARPQSLEWIEQNNGDMLTMKRKRKT